MKLSLKTVQYLNSSKKIKLLILSHLTHLELQEIYADLFGTFFLMVKTKFISLIFLALILSSNSKLLILSS